MRRALLLLVLGLATTSLAHAQEEPTDGAEEPEEFGADIGFYDPGGQALESFHASLRGAAEGTRQARVIFYGASHVAADFFQNVIRERMQARFGDAGHGFLMPARPWRHYRHLGGLTVESSRRHWEGMRVRASTREVEALGVAGMAVEASSASAFGRIDTGDATAGRFVVFYLRRPEGGTFDITLDGRRVARIDTDATEVAAGSHTITTDDAHHVLEFRPRGDGPIRLFGVSIEREQPGVIVDTMGLNGARVSSHLLWNEEMHAEYLRRLDPSLVVLAYGTNESGDTDFPIERYEAQLRTAVARIRGTTPNASCLLIGPSDRPMREGGEIVDRPRTHLVVDVQRRVSRDFGCAFFDLVEFGGGPLSMVRWSEHEPPYARGDLVHFTGRAYRRLGEVLHDSLLRGLEPE